MAGPFKLRSGNTTPFKQMGSSPAKRKGAFIYDVDDEPKRVPYSEAKKHEEGGGKVKYTGPEADRAIKESVKKRSEKEKVDPGKGHKEVADAETRMLKGMKEYRKKHMQSDEAIEERKSDRAQQQEVERQAKKAKGEYAEKRPAWQKRQLRKDKLKNVDVNKPTEHDISLSKSRDPHKSPAKQTEGEKKRVKIEHKGSTEYVRGGREGDKTTRSVEYRPQTHEGSKGRVTKTVRKKDKSGKVTRKDKTISKTRAKIEKGIKNIFHKK